MDPIKVIENFQFPMDSALTPYNISEFSREVEEICDAEKAFLSVLQDSSYKNANEVEGCVKQIKTSRSRLRVAKCIVVGDTSVGKTCLVHRLVEKTYANNFKATTGVDFEVQKYQILGRPFTLQVCLFNNLFFSSKNFQFQASSIFFLFVIKNNIKSFPLFCVIENDFKALGMFLINTKEK